MLDKGGTFHRRPEAGSVHPVAPVVDAGVFPCERCGERGISRAQARPQLAADDRAHAGAEFVVVGAAKRRVQPLAYVALGNAVFIKDHADMIHPGLRKIAPMHRQPETPHTLEPDHLKVQIVVGEHFGRNGIVIGQIDGAFLTFKRRCV